MEAAAAACPSLPACLQRAVQCSLLLCTSTRAALNTPTVALTLCRRFKHLPRPAPLAQRDVAGGVDYCRRKVLLVKDKVEQLAGLVKQRQAALAQVRSSGRQWAGAGQGRGGMSEDRGARCWASLECGRGGNAACRSGARRAFAACPASRPPAPVHNRPPQVEALLEQHLGEQQAAAARQGAAAGPAAGQK